MKKILFFSIVAVLTLLSSCRKGPDELQPRYSTDLQIFTVTGSDIVSTEVDYVDYYRRPADPIGYTILADSGAKRFDSSYVKAVPEIITQIIAEYNTTIRDHPIDSDHPQHERNWLWQVMIRVSVDQDMYRVCPELSERFLRELKGYCENPVNGNRFFVNGVRDSVFENHLKNLINETALVYNERTEKWEPRKDGLTYKKLYWDYLWRYAENSSTKKKYQREGFMDLNLGDHLS